MLDYRFPYFGPLVFHVKLTLEEVKKVKLICNKNKSKDARSGLAGIINQEFYISITQYQKIVEPYLKAYEQAYNNFYNKTIKPITCNSAWVNYMKAGESNPIHRHTNCQFSSVLYTDIPKQLEKENLSYKGTSAGPGSIIFYYGEPRDHNISEFAYFPKVGDMFIFPYNLMHQVMPFKSKGERVSVAANFV